VLIRVIEAPRSTLREIAGDVGITDRAALSLLRALEEDRIISREREGRKNLYTVDMDALMSHKSGGRYTIAQVASALFALSGKIPGVELPPGMQIRRDNGDPDGAG
jgi:hypothetical protein